MPINANVPKNNKVRSPFKLPSSNFTFHTFLSINAAIENGNKLMNIIGNKAKRSFLNKQKIK